MERSSSAGPPDAINAIARPTNHRADVDAHMDAKATDNGGDMEVDSHSQLSTDGAASDCDDPDIHGVSGAPHVDVDDALDDDAYATMISAKEAEEEAFVDEVIDQEDEDDAAHSNRGCVILDVSYSRLRNRYTFSVK